MKIRITEDLVRQAYEATKPSTVAGTWYCAECVLAAAIRDQAQLPEPFVVVVTGSCAWLHRKIPTDSQIVPHARSLTAFVRGGYDYDQVREAVWSEKSERQVRGLLPWFDRLSRDLIPPYPEGFFVPPITELDLPELADLLKGVEEKP